MHFAALTSCLMQFYDPFEKNVNLKVRKVISKFCCSFQPEKATKAKRRFSTKKSK